MTGYGGCSPGIVEGDKCAFCRSVVHCWPPSSGVRFPPPPLDQAAGFAALRASALARGTKRGTSGRTLFEAVAVIGDVDVGVEVEALKMGLVGAAGGHPRHARPAPDLQHPRPSAWPEGTAALDRALVTSASASDVSARGSGGVVVGRVSD